MKKVMSLFDNDSSKYVGFAFIEIPSRSGEAIRFGLTARHSNVLCQASSSHRATGPATTTAREDMRCGASRKGRPVSCLGADQPDTTWNTATGKSSVPSTAEAYQRPPGRLPPATTHGKCRGPAPRQLGASW